MAEPIVSLSGITKSFGGVKALVKGELDLYPGQVTALVGENGAGKSTLVKILTGVYQADSGTIRLGGEVVQIGSADEAQQMGISAIHQEAVIFDDLSVAENIFISNRPRRHGFVDWAEMRRRAAAILATLNSDIDPSIRMRQLSVAQKHLVQIAHALSYEARVVIMDEPTAALSYREAQELFAIVRRLKAEGRAILFISHKFEDIFVVADRYAVFRDGAAIEQGQLADTDNDKLISLMVGRTVSQVFPKLPAEIGGEVLRVESLSRWPEFADISFSVRRGEILGVYGLVGAGRSEVMQAIFGHTIPDSGHVFLNGQELHVRRPEDAINHGIAYLPEDRQGQGTLLRLSIGQNITLPILSRFVHHGFLHAGEGARVAEEMARHLQVKMSSIDQPVQELSGGNQQKVVIAKWLATDPRVLILDEPTKGIDVGTKATVHRFISELAQRGLAVIMVTSELPEVLGMADRILVMRRGRLQASFDRAEATPEIVVRAATDA
jgi:rhamnose transport system ATP-binding protein